MTALMLVDIQEENFRELNHILSYRELRCLYLFD